jgi:hypothetical protein
MTETTPYMTNTPDLDLRAAMRDPFTIVPQVLDLVRLNGAILFRSDFRSPWAYTSPPVQELLMRCRTLLGAWCCSRSSPKVIAGSPWTA